MILGYFGYADLGNLQITPCLESEPESLRSVDQVVLQCIYCAFRVGSSSEPQPRPTIYYTNGVPAVRDVIVAPGFQKPSRRRYSK